MRSYQQYCAIAKALDVVGDRWSLLVVRELLAGPRKYGQLLDGLPGIATNLLAERLRQLSAAGVVERRVDGGYELTSWGEGLAEPIYALARWAAPLMGPKASDEAFRSHWLRHPVRTIYGEADPRRPRLTVEVRAGGPAMTIESAGGVVDVRPGPPARPDLVLAGPPDGILGLLAGRIDAPVAEEMGVTILGDVRKLRRLRPHPAMATGS